MKSRNIFLLLMITCKAYSQYTFVKQWDYRFGGIGSDGFNSFQQTGDEGYILAGYSDSGISGDRTQTSRGGSDYWMVKIDSIGAKQWDKRFGTIGEDIPWIVKQTPDSGYIIGGAAGATPSGGDKTESGKGGEDFWLIKTDKNGNKTWDKILGGGLNDFLGTVISTNDGGYLVGGSSASNISGDKTEANWDTSQFLPWEDFWIVKLDSQGHKLWDKRYGGIEQEILTGIEPIDGGYILMGQSRSDSSGNKTQNAWGFPSSGDAWLVKVDSLGNKQWDKRFGGTGEDKFISGCETKDGGYILGGFSTSSNDGNKTSINWGYWIVKVDSLGNAEWDKAFGQADELYSLTVTRDGYLLCGHSYGSLGGDKSENNLGNLQSWIVKIDSSGNKQWDKTIFTNASWGGTAVQTSDGCYAIANTTSGEIGGYKTQLSWGDSSADYWILKFCMEPFSDINTPKSTKGDLNSQIQVWPNPFTTDLSIALTGEHPTGAEFTITNPLGQTIYHQTESNLATGYTKMLDLSPLPSGIYFLGIVSGGRASIKRIVKQ